MNVTNANALSSSRAWAVLGLCGVLAAIAGGTAIAQSSESAGPTPVGTWLVEVTLRDCRSNTPLGPPTNTVVTFHRGGTISESTGPSPFAPGQRTSGHGILAEEKAGVYRQRMIWLIVFDSQPNLPGTPDFNPAMPISPGFFAGRQEVTHTVEFTDADNFVSSGTNAFFKTNGDLYRTGCSTTKATRFQ